MYRTTWHTLTYAKCDSIAQCDINHDMLKIRDLYCFTQQVSVPVCYVACDHAHLELKTLYFTHVLNVLSIQYRGVQGHCTHATFQQRVNMHVLCFNGGMLQNRDVQITGRMCMCDACLARSVY